LLENRTQGYSERPDFIHTPMENIVENNNYILEDDMDEGKPAIHKRVKDLQVPYFVSYLLIMIGSWKRFAT